MDIAREILEKHLSKDLNIKSYLRTSPLTYQVVLDAIEEAINYTHCCKSDSEQLVCVVDYLNNFTKGKNYECKPDGKKHFEVYDDFGNWYSVHKKCFSTPVVIESCTINGKGLCEYSDKLGFCPRCDTDAYSR